MKVAHIISHSHWDREWYLPYELHHMRLIMLIDQILNAIDNDPDFKSFHLDGQTISVDDYLQVKPQNREKLLDAIQSKKINIGPWYVLQDAFLTSAEANVRNGLYGHIDCMRYGGKTSVGYYPDTFGIYSQAPQILSELEVDNMIFGRGVSTTGFNNEVSNEFESKFSEMIVQSTDGTSVLGILFANWYSNGNEIPVDREEAKKYWDQKIMECSRYTDSNHLLFMNGCDHTPYQENVTEAIKIANEIYPDIHFKQSSFEEYLTEIKNDIQLKNLTKIGGELTSQSTDGYYTLVNTASSRISQKIKNAQLQDQYEYIVEPLEALYSDEYQHSEIEYGWKKLMQNHPHDSICGCSVDSVHNTMESRFEDSLNVANHVIDRTINQYITKLDGGNKLAFTLFNPSEIANTRHKVKIEYDRAEFGSNFREARDRMKELKIPHMVMKDLNGNTIPVAITDCGIGFDYYLPDDKFRRPYYSRNIEVEFSYKMDFVGHKTFFLEPADDQLDSNRSEVSNLENDFIKVTINENGSMNIHNKQTNRSQTNLLRIFDQGDIGNEYMFGSVKDDQELFIHQVSEIIWNKNQVLESCKVKAVLEVPKSADELLAKEQLEIIEYNARLSKRTAELVLLPVTIEYSLNKYDYGVKVKVSIDNVASDHRIRARFELENASDSHLVDTAFETVTRSNKVLDSWKNPNADMRMSKFVRIFNDCDSLTVATLGLHEYELKNNALDVTLLRAVGELGDWGYFPTPNAQCHSVVECELYIFFDSSEHDDQLANQARSIFVSQPIKQLGTGKDVEPLDKLMLDIAHDPQCYISTIKRNINDELIIRFGSNGNQANFTTSKSVSKTNMLETVDKPMIENIVAPNQILTIKVGE
ncbi:glycoside hydrolase family 38 C-terminal domain-containing protein [Mollicutes bacterium LVI A0039]|nr:glycoside hydrolase family 38 C-terminal domain-containing protein [Mollicutes bacterium LVI A0039]